MGVEPLLRCLRCGELLSNGAAHRGRVRGGTCDAIFSPKVLWCLCCGKRVPNSRYHTCAQLLRPATPEIAARNLRVFERFLPPTEHDAHGAAQ